MRPTLLALCAAVAVSAPAVAQVPDFYDPEIVRSVYLNFSQPNFWTLLEQNYPSRTDIEADMVVDGVTYPRVGARFRGNTSYSWLPRGSEKKSFNVTLDAFVQSQDIWGYDSLNFNNGFHDPTFMREFLVYMVARRYGPAPKCNFIKLYLNGQYWGIYINVQQPNKDMIKEWFRSNDGNRYRGYPTSGGFFNGRTALTWLGSLPSSYLSAYEAKQGDGTDLMNLCNVLNNTPTAQLQAALPAVFSVDQFYRYAAAMNVMLQTDSYIGSGKDYMLYHDEIHGDFHVFPFDVNEGLAAEGGGPTYSPFTNSTNAQRPALSKTLQFPDWRARYVAHFRTIAEENMSWSILGPIIAHYQGMIAADVAADTKKIYTTAQFTQNVTQAVIGPGAGGRNVTIPGLRPTVDGREAYLANIAELNTPRPALANLTHSPASPGASTTVTVTVRATGAGTVTLFSRTVGPFASQPMFDDGAHGDGAPNDGVYGAFVPPSPPGTVVEYYVESAAAGGGIRYLPKTAEHLPGSYRIDWPTGSSPLKLNEFVARNVTGIVDEAGQHEDWLELYNDSAVPFVADGMYLTDNLSLLKYRIPNGTTIPARGTLLVWCDEDGTQGPYHANFKLSASGEEIGLFAADQMTLVDYITFGPQLADVATARLLDGGAPWVTIPVPTPRSRNQPIGCGVRAYGALDPTTHGMALAVLGSPQIGTSLTQTITGGPPSGLAHVMLAPAADAVSLAPFGLGDDTLLLRATGLLGPITLRLDPTGHATTVLGVPNDAGLIGARVYLQALAPAAGALDTSNAVELTICP